jgi:pyrrolysine biosynthesis protein PylC
MGLKTGTVVLFDMNAYRVSSSKKKSNALFIQNHLPVPAVYPACGYPVILKPDGQSGSAHVKKAYAPEEVKDYLKLHPHDKTVIQEYMEGASYSLEVIGDGKRFYFPQITEVITDKAYDCKRIVAPGALRDEEKRQMLDLGKKLAEQLKIKGIFDIEVISHNGRLKLLEIDARFPSQTPISVYHSTGMNMVEMMVNLALGDAGKVRVLPAKQVCLYQQIQVRGGKISVQGEHMIGSCKGLKIHADFFGSTEAITDYEAGSRDWKAIVIVTGDDERHAYQNFLGFIETLRLETGLENWELVEG